MNTENETVNDIVVETYFECDRATEQTTWNRSEVERIMHRVESAHEREKESVIAAQMLKDKERGDEIDRLRETICRLYRSLNGICEWTRCAQEHLPPFGNNYRGAIDCVHAESESAIVANTEFAAEALKGAVNG